MSFWNKPRTQVTIPIDPPAELTVEYGRGEATFLVDQAKAGIWGGGEPGGTGEGLWRCKNGNSFRRTFDDRNVIKSAPSYERALRLAKAAASAAWNEIEGTRQSNAA